jgi:hypothetical protein
MSLCKVVGKLVAASIILDDIADLRGALVDREATEYTLLVQSVLNRNPDKLCVRRRNVNSLAVAPADLTQKETNTADHAVLTPGNFKPIPCQYLFI